MFELNHSSSRHSFSFANKALLVLPVLASLGVHVDAYAACSASAGTVASPAKGATVTCSGTIEDTRIGDGSTNAVVVLENNTSIDNSGSSEAIYLNITTVTLGSGTSLTSDGTNIVVRATGSLYMDAGSNDVTISGTYDAMLATGGIELTLGGGSITSTNRDAISSTDGSVTVLGSPSDLTISGGSNGIYAKTFISLTLGDDVTIKSNGNDDAIEAATETVTISGAPNNFTVDSQYSGISANTNITLTLGNNASITGYLYSGIKSTSGEILLTLGSNASLVSTYSTALEAQDGGVSILGSPTSLTVTAANQAILAENDIALTLGSASTITSSARSAIQSNNGDITIGGSPTNLKITGQVSGIYADGGDVALTLGSGATIKGTTGYAVIANGTTSITTGSNATFMGTNGGIASTGTTLTLGENSTIQTTNGAAISNATSVTIGSGSTVRTTAGTTAISGSGNADSVTNYGTVSGTTYSISLGNGNDNLTLGTGSVLTGNVAAGNGTDGLQLQGTGSEDAVFSGFETLTMSGSEWTLTADSTFTTTSVNSGQLNIKGTLTSDVTIAANAILGGAGTIIGDITNNGTLSPGNSVGTRIITGNFVQGSSGALTIEINATSNDLVDISGTATIDGTLNLVNSSGTIKAGDSITFLSADGGITGSFASVTDNIFALDAVASTDGQNYIATFQLSDTSTTLPTSDSTINTLINNSSDLGSVRSVINSLPTTQAQTNALASQTGFVQAASGAVALQALRKTSNSVANRQNISSSIAHSGVSGLSAGDVRHKGYTYWSDVQHGFGQIDGNGYHRSVDYTLWGFTAGVEKRRHDKWTGLFTGFSVAQTKATIEIDDKATSNIYQLGAYHGQRFGQWRGQGMLSGSWIDSNVTRHTSTGTAEADYQGYSLIGDGQFSYDIAYSGWNIAPLVGTTAVMIIQGDVDESGSGVLDMYHEGDTTYQWLGRLGVEISRNVAINNYQVEPKVMLGWEQQLHDSTDYVDNHFAIAPTESFSTYVPQKEESSLLVGADLNVSSLWNDQLDLYVNYDGNLATRESEHSFRLGVKYRY